MLAIRAPARSLGASYQYLTSLLYKGVHSRKGAGGPMVHSVASHGLRFEDKVAIVTGGCVGIGRGCADVLAEQGGLVAVLDIDDKEGKALESMNGPGEMHYIHCNMAEEEDIKNAIEEVVKKYGRIDCLVNNVANHPRVHTIDDLTVDGFKNLLNINVVSGFTASKYALPYLRTTKGNIVNITSVSAHAGTGQSSTYCATKGGLLSLAKALAIDEAKHGVRVNSIPVVYAYTTFLLTIRDGTVVARSDRISPAWIYTPLCRRINGTEKEPEVDEETLKYLGSQHLLGRIGEPREIGMACLFLAVDATFTTGEELLCSGGSEVGFGVKL